VQHFCEFCALFRKEEIQIHKHFAMTLSDIRINRKITTNNEKLSIYGTGQALEDGQVKSFTNFSKVFNYFNTKLLCMGCGSS